MAKKYVEIMEILEAFDLTRSAWSAAELVGCDAKTVAHYVSRRDAGLDPFGRGRRPRLVDPYLDKIEEWVDHSRGKVRADVAFDRLRAMGFAGDERTVRRAVAEAKAAYTDGKRRTYRPWVPEPGMWLQYDWGAGPVINPGRHYGMQVETCVPYDPETKGGAEATVKIAKADLVPTDANLLAAYRSFRELVTACEDLENEVNERPHRETRRKPAEMLVEERVHLHTLPAEPYAAALGETRSVRDDQIVRWGSVPYSTPPGHVGQEVWCRVEGEELVIVGRDPRGRLVEIIRHELSTPGHPRILDEHYPGHPNGRGVRQPRLKPRSDAERDFLAIGPGAETWLRGAAGTGAARVRSKMARAVELAALCGQEQVDEALRRAARSERFGDGDLASILEHLDRPELAVVTPDERHSTQPGTGVWKEFGR